MYCNHDLCFEQNVHFYKLCIWHCHVFVKNMATHLWRQLHKASTCIDITKTRPCNKQRFFLALKIENFQLKNVDIFLIFAQNIDCGYSLEPPRRGGSIEYPQSMFWSKNKKKRYTPANPSFTI